MVPGDLQCDPRAIARALAREAAERGGGGAHRRARSRRSTSPAAGVARRAHGGGTIAAGAVVLAAGPWTRAAGGERRRAAAARAAQGPARPAARAGPASFVRHKVVDGSYLGARSAAADAGLQLSTVVETTWEGDVLVGSSRERRGFDAAVDPAVSDAMLERAARLFPALRGAASRPTRGRACARGCPTTCRRSGRRRRSPGLWLATGHEGAGVALGPVTGRLVAQLYCGEPPVVDPAPFAPDRFAEAAG